MCTYVCVPTYLCVIQSKCTCVGEAGGSDSVTRWPAHLFNIWPFATMKICPIAQKIGKSRFKILPNTLNKPSKFPKANKKWLNFAKSGHTVPTVSFRAMTYSQQTFCLKK